MRPLGPCRPTAHHGEFEPAALARAKGDHVVSVCLPARDEAATVGAIVRRIDEALVRRVALVDEILVVDDHSEDATAEVAADAGARVVSAADVLPEYGKGHGKGEALWKSVYEARGDLIVWCDADVVDFDPQFVTGLMGPLLTIDEVGFVKGCYERPAADGDRGGRVTELVARPLLAALYPALTCFAQPLGGECAARREVVEVLPFVEGYGVDVALLIDVVDRFGLGAVAQVDLGRRVHRNRPIDELSPQATAVMQTILTRAGRAVPSTIRLVRPGLDPVDVESVERPPLVTVPSYQDLARGA